MVKIRHAKPHDAKRVLEILDGTYNPGISEAVEGERSLIDAACYKRRISSTQFFYVAKKHGDIEGFLAAYPFGGIWEGILSRDPVVRFLEYRCPESLYWDRMAIVQCKGTEGIARKLTKELHKEATEENFRAVICAIKQGPANDGLQSSLVERMGYRIEEEALIDGQAYTVYRRNLVSRITR